MLPVAVSRRYGPKVDVIGSPGKSCANDDIGSWPIAVAWPCTPTGRNKGPKAMTPRKAAIINKRKFVKWIERAKFTSPQRVPALLTLGSPIMTVR
jgi:hypothetical protein